MDELVVHTAEQVNGRSCGSTAAECSIENTDEVTEVRREDVEEGDESADKRKDADSAGIRKSVSAQRQGSKKRESSDNQENQGKKVKPAGNGTRCTRTGSRGSEGSGGCPEKKAPMEVKKPVPKTRDWKFNEEKHLMCHQCHRNDKGKVVSCKKCRCKRYCISCINNWYPKMSEDEVAKSCPFCRDNCNCKACLSRVPPRKILDKALKNQLSSSKRDQHFHYILQALLPEIKKFSEQQMLEKGIETKIQGKDVSIAQAHCDPSERLYCDVCRTSIVDFHRSCPKCGIDLCLMCCSEIRNDDLRGGEKEVLVQYFNRGFDYLHGKLPDDISVEEATLRLPSKFINEEYEKTCQWKTNEDGSIPCPPKEFGGCGDALLELRCMFAESVVASLVEKAEEIVRELNHADFYTCFKQKCVCQSSYGIDNGDLRKAAFRADPSDDFLYCPKANNFQERLRAFSATLGQW